jgi:hypothetical protein
MKLNEWIKTHKLTCFTTILAVVSIIMAVVFYFNPMNLENINYSIKNYNLFVDYTSKLNDLTIKYKNNIVKDLTITNISIWNSGKITIDKKDIPLKAPLGISITGNILDYQLLYSSNKANNIILNKTDSGKLLINFDYLDVNDGFVIQLIHDQKSISSSNIIGNIKGIGALKNKNVNKSINILLLLVVIICFIGIIFLSYYIGKYTESKQTKRAIFCIIGNSLVLLILIFSLLNYAPISGPTNINTGIPSDMIQYMELN